eukprot:GILI01038204.1.p1 GENE.GILI01038204.1~~GILI01038204.1.p1  ORF type:complete len:338 (-),score=28.84 GILI01038204.1:107-1120(-)
MLGVFLSPEEGLKVSRELTIPSPGPRDAFVKVLRSGICMTDVQMTRGYKADFRGVLGHEFVGVVQAVGYESTHSSHLIGRRVVASINVPCGSCHVCALGVDFRRNHCPNRSCMGIVGRGGCHAEYVVIPVDNLLVVPDNVSDSEAVFAEPLAAACRIFEQGLVKSYDRVAVLGDGKLGLLITEVLAISHSPSLVTVFGRSASKLALVPPSVTTVNTWTHPELNSYHSHFDVVIEATGSPSGLDQAVALVKPLGYVVVKSTCAGPVPFEAAAAVVKEVRLVGSRCGPMELAMELLSDKRIDVSRFISAEFPLAQADEAFKKATESGVLKIQLVVSQVD